MMKYVIKKTTKYPNGMKGVYYITRHFGCPGKIGDSELKDAFLDRNEADMFMMRMISYDYPYRKKGFGFEYEIIEI